MYVAKPHQKGAPHALDASGKSAEVKDLTAFPDTDLIPSVDNMPYNNPDAAGGSLSPIPSCEQGVPVQPARAGNMSGGGVLHPTAETTAPMSNPAPAPMNSVNMKS